ncbi:TonB-dependent receptor [Solimonas sp. K1W22B-7]|uniref:TonB-dependent receptor n=1 Tax=Solimonas sp. K1W22B-7 TaxID=2303331 RepID=UPI000E332F98|nr:TonB-dependent receptor [Solimonas sp. K1W22B-7]AXQ29390.1 TonB-dependent receptor [Solimonas sp. K1W22B-7]
MQKKWATGAILLLAASAVQAQGDPGTAASGSPESDSDLALDELLSAAETENNAAAAATPAESAPPPADAASGDAATPTPDVLPTIPVAQQPEPLPETKPAAPRSAQIEEIVVTATKREQSIREIPASISALTGADLERSGAQGVEDMARMVPGVNFSADSINASKVTIRGISTTTLGNPTTGVLFGDVSFTESYLPRVTLDPNPFDMQTVEVLKGPQGTLFGSAALNGAVRYVPQPVKFGEYETRWFAQYSMVEQGGSEPMYGAAVNVPFGEDLAFRAMGFKRDAPGWIDNTRTGAVDVNSLSQEGARGLVGWRPTENWDVRLTYLWQQTNVNDFPFAGGRDGELTRESTTKPSPIDSQYELADLVLRYSFESMDLVSDTAWVGKSAHKLMDTSTDLTGTTFPFVLLEDISNSDTYSQELRLVSTDTASDWRWVGGVVGSRQDIFFVPQYSIELLPGLNLQGLLEGLGLPADNFLARGDSLNLLRVLTKAKVDELALFGDLTRRVGDSVELSLGGRLYRSKSDGYVLQDGVFVLLKGRPEVVNDRVIKESGFNPKASAQWRATDDVMFYTAVSKGFRSGGLQPGFTTSLSAKQAPEEFTSDTLWNYEAGTRTSWLENTLHLDATAFYIDWTDPQILLGDSVIHLPYLDNVGRVKSTGVEAAMQWLPSWVPGLSVNASAAYIRTQTAEAFEGQTGATIPEGTPWPYAPRWQTATTLSYAREFGNWRAGSAVTHAWLGKSHTDLEMTQSIFGFQTWDAQLSLANPAIVWLPEMSVTVSNLTDERGISNATVGGVVTQTEKTTYIQPRTVLLRLGGSF